MSIDLGGQLVEQHMSILGGAGQVTWSGQSVMSLLCLGQHLLSHVRTTFGLHGAGRGQHGAGPPQESHGGGHPPPGHVGGGAHKHGRGHCGASGGGHIGRQHGQFGRRMLTAPCFPQHITFGGAGGAEQSNFRLGRLCHPPPPQQDIFQEAFTLHEKFRENAKKPWTTENCGWEQAKG